ncbi:protein UXT isoform X4 [Falco peregrinus]|uniref:protein UXT isoform X4 n=1 Tax=Falco peregrinus TaxID=8954 RepID=UPI00247ACE73|nr:protein UXT isoform X4 [Falco peregrinus]
MTRDGRPHPFSRAMSRCDDVSAAMAAAEKAQRYEAFVSDVLRRDLRAPHRRVQEQRDGVFEQQAQEAAAPLHTQVDLGCNFFVTAEVPSPQRVFCGSGLWVLCRADAARGPAPP